MNSILSFVVQYTSVDTWRFLFITIVSKTGISRTNSSFLVFEGLCIGFIAASSLLDPKLALLPLERSSAAKENKNELKQWSPFHRWGRHEMHCSVLSTSLRLPWLHTWVSDRDNLYHHQLVFNLKYKLRIVTWLKEQHSSKGWSSRQVPGMPWAACSERFTGFPSVPTQRCIQRTGEASSSHKQPLPSSVIASDGTSYAAVFSSPIWGLRGIKKQSSVEIHTWTWGPLIARVQGTTSVQPKKQKSAVQIH